MELMFSEYILGQCLTLISDVISCFEEQHEIMSDKGFLKQFMSEKIIQFSEAEEAANTNCCIYIDWAIQKLTNINMGEPMLQSNT